MKRTKAKSKAKTGAQRRVSAGSRGSRKVVERRLDSVTPGELLLEEFMLPMGLTAYRLAKEIDVPAQRIGEILKGRRAITADTDLRLCKFFGLTSGYWLRAQIAHDLEVQESKIEKALQKIIPWTE